MSKKHACAGRCRHEVLLGRNTYSGRFVLLQNLQTGISDSNSAFYLQNENPGLQMGVSDFDLPCKM